MNNINIVPMTADHLDALEQLERTCFSRPWSRKMLAEELDHLVRAVFCLTYIGNRYIMALSKYIEYLYKEEVYGGR